MPPVVRYSVAAAVASTALLLPLRRLESPRATSRIATLPVVVAANDMAAGTHLASEAESYYRHS
jgi:hypothetical protein